MANQNIAADFTEVLSYISSAVGWPSRCTLQSPPSAAVPSSTGSGQVNLSTWSDVPGFVSIECLKAPYNARLVSKDWEQRQPEKIMEFGWYTVLLNGSWSEADIEQSWRAVVDGTPYDIKGVVTSSLKVGTWLVVQRADV